MASVVRGQLINGKFEYKPPRGHWLAFSFHGEALPFNVWSLDFLSFQNPRMGRGRENQKRKSGNKIVVQGKGPASESHPVVRIVGGLEAVLNNFSVRGLLREFYRAGRPRDLGGWWR